MNKLRRFLALLLLLVSVCGLAACTQGRSGPTPSPEDRWPEDVYEVRMILPYLNTPPSVAAVQRTEDTINHYLLHTRGITDFKLDLSVLAIAYESTIVPMNLAAGEPMDIISVDYRNIASYSTGHYLLPLDDYLRGELREASALVEEFLPCYTLEGHLYALPSWSGQVGDYRFIYNKELVDPVCDMSEVDSWDEVLAVLDRLKEVYPEEHFLCYSSTFPAIYALQDHTNTVGTYAATVGESTSLRNYYATDAFRLACEKAYELRNRGMLDSEGSANSLNHDALTYSGSTKGVLMMHALTEESVVEMFNRNNTYGATFDAVTIGRTDMPNARFSYGIAYTSENPSAAARMLNLIWTDEFIYNTLGFGTEGVDYVKTDVEGVIAYPEGLGQYTVPYNCIYVLASTGDYRKIWSAPGGTSQRDLAFIEEQMANCYIPPAFGFLPDSAPVAEQMAAVAAVVEQYNEPLIYGDVDPTVYLPRFLEALERAGIGDIVAEYQSQFDAWLAAGR